MKSGSEPGAWYPEFMESGDDVRENPKEKAAAEAVDDAVNDVATCAARRYTKIDHIALAVHDLEQAVHLFTHVLGFTLVRRRTIKGDRTGMISAELEHNQIKFVLCQGTEPASQVSRLIENFGPGLAHIALAVDDVEMTAEDLALQGMSFDTNVIKGAGLRQVFSSRDHNSGMCFEFIERTGEDGFLQENVQELFSQLEKKGTY
ncbi:VOC family protein [Herbaspirillum sp. GCM10030257]|uniref:VOC family protein n=1 Tax=Herbaspirillum sp. GCM10030257 TaxID=3273393 RepID=UPI003615520A